LVLHLMHGRWYIRHMMDMFGGWLFTQPYIGIMGFHVTHITRMLVL
jgi:hypothetical protein